MKIVNLAVLAFASCILAKNIFYLDDLVSAMNNEKREPKNVVSLDSLKEDAENAVYENEPKFNPGNQEKRELQDVLQPSAPLLQSLLPQFRQISVFSGYLRNDQDFVSKLENSDSFVLIVAPTDEAFARVSVETGKKPWEYPEEIQGNETDDEVIKKNLRFLVESHVSAPIDRELAEKKSVTLLNGQEISIEHLSGPDNYELNVNGKKIPILSILQAENGLVLVVDSVLK